MSYIVAFVRFAKSEELYPVNCWRSDAKEGDAVVVRMNSKAGILQWAEIVFLTYFNWKCVNFIECLDTEADFTAHGIIIRDGATAHRGVNRPIDVWDSLKDDGWALHRPNGKNFKFACSLHSGTEYCTIRFRKNGIDLQIIDREIYCNPRNLFPRFFPGQGHMERIDLRNSDMNAFEYVLDLAVRFSRGADYTDLKRPGRSTRHIPWAPSVDEDTSWKSAFDTSDGPAYLHDGLYL